MFCITRCAWGLGQQKSSGGLTGLSHARWFTPMANNWCTHRAIDHSTHQWCLLAQKVCSRGGIPRIPGGSHKSSDGLTLEGTQSHFNWIVLVKDQIRSQTSFKGDLALDVGTVEEFAVLLIYHSSCGVFLINTNYSVTFCLILQLFKCLFILHTRFSAPDERLYVI